MNKFKEVAALFGLELWEEFNVGFASDEKVDFRQFKFTVYGLIDVNGIVYDWLLSEILRGGCIIEKLPWKPKDGDEYFYVDQRGEIMDKIYNDSLFDVMCFKLVNFFKTEEEAKQNIDKIINMLEE